MCSYITLKLNNIITNLIKYYLMKLLLFIYFILKILILFMNEKYMIRLNYVGVRKIVL